MGRETHCWRLHPPNTQWRLPDRDRIITRNAWGAIMIQPPYWFRITIASQSFTVDVGIFSFLHGTFVRLRNKHQENQISLSYQILPLVLKLLLRPMLGELGFQGTMTGKSGTNHKRWFASGSCKPLHSHLLYATQCQDKKLCHTVITTLAVLTFRGLLPLNSWIPSMTRWAWEWETCVKCGDGW